ncbi:hypothetical protein AYO44_11535 [Planctomycetaceae bacterium SCGC AG-212-F19]|nr:hypothetical protein AYO44_11535 [Planctomycetaceae bacterium SCGC AG-212-F19]
MARQAWQFLPLTLLTSFLVPTMAPAQLQFAEPVVNVGTVYAGQPLVRQFTFVNVGEEPVEVIEAKGSCACAVGKLSGGTFLPGKIGAVEIAVHTLGQPAGPSSWGIKVSYKVGAVVKEMPLQINGDLVTEVHCEPAALQLIVREGLAATVTIDWQSSLFDALKTVHVSSPFLKAQLQPGPFCDLGRSAQSVRVEVLANFPEGRHDEVISVYTDSPRYRELQVPVTVVKAAPQRIAATPSQLVLVALPGQPVSSRVVLLRDAQNESVQIDNITADHPALSCSWAVGPGEMATLKVRVDAKAVPAEGLRSAVHVEIHQPVRQTVTLPVEIRRDH